MIRVTIKFTRKFVDNVEFTQEQFCQQLDLIKEILTGAVDDLSLMIIPNRQILRNCETKYESTVTSKRGSSTTDGIYNQYFLAFECSLTITLTSICLINSTEQSIQDLLNKIAQNLLNTERQKLNALLNYPDDDSMEIDAQYSDFTEEMNPYKLKFELDEILDYRDRATSNSKLVDSLDVKPDELPSHYLCLFTSQLMSIPAYDTRNINRQYIEYDTYKDYIECHGHNPFNRQGMTIRDLGIDAEHAAKIVLYVSKLRAISDQACDLFRTETEAREILLEDWTQESKRIMSPSLLLQYNELNQRNKIMQDEKSRSNQLARVSIAIQQKVRP